uniref:Carboxylic ester hydrolase n=1 Tax=Corethrella appendiculata TaxID=1370023 RepID=U5EVS7_9DIPT
MRLSFIAILLLCGSYRRINAQSEETRPESERESSECDEVIDESVCSETEEKNGCENQSPCVCLSSGLGCIRGKIMPGYQIQSFEGFLGIPFAKPPVNELRFQNPVPNEPWNGVLDATAEKLFCVQLNVLVPNAAVMGDEDCLYLYVYRPKSHNFNKRKLPVMLHIHGGGLFSGSGGPSFTGPEYFMDTEEVIFVSIQYRLSVLGFLSTGDQFAPGNFGFKDQSLAMKWVYENIEDFGGDREQITIFGQSAGAWSVHLHMMSKLSEGYFSKAILMSGSAIAPYAHATRNPINTARRQAEAVNIKNAHNLTSKDLVEELRKINAASLMESVQKLKAWSHDPLTLYRNVIEDEAVGSFITEDPRTIWKRGDYRKIPWMTGYVPVEGAVRGLAIATNPLLREKLNSDFEKTFEVLMELQGSSPQILQDKVQKIINCYLNGSAEVTENNTLDFVRTYSQRAFITPMIEGVSQHVKNGFSHNSPVSLYKFSYRGPFSFSLFYTGLPTDFGVVHCDDLIYLLRQPALLQDFEKNSLDAKMITKFVEFFVDFAYNGVATKLVPYKKCTPNSNSSLPAKCDFIEFTNSADGTNIDIRTTNEVNNDEVLFWRYIDSYV